MKKIILSIAILASGVSTYAMSNNITPATSITITMNDEFTEVSVDELPAAVTSAVEKDFPTSTISKAYANTNGQYKLELTADSATNTVYIDKNGNWLEESAVK
ncbi:hypothetical protein FHR24_001944 [Wenyingzhuangia heitensis]|uniref:Beta-lactamase-inhibitor-like, PepSY-like n=1 Tax=Wenyingzhuangia heitensis TaxID=1487859 RepID=A0ABX0UDC4_9FLAO|nr:hypothetical protein [Wenyingzhuangia heitensis]NIJ45476.1 hypothetical protein [Wenyingzhuangia heitensis]